MSEKFQVGQIIEGTVTGVKPFGAFVALDADTQGLVHISHVTHGFLENIADAVKVGDTVKVKLLSIDGDSGKISLSMKQATPPPPRPERSERSDRPERSERYERSDRPSRPQRQSRPAKKEALPEDFESLMKGFLKDSNDRQTDINKRLNR